MHHAEIEFKKQATVAQGPGEASKRRAFLDEIDVDLMDSDDDHDNGEDDIVVDGDSVLQGVKDKWEKQKARLKAKAKEVMVFDEVEVGDRYDIARYSERAGARI